MNQKDELLVLAAHFSRGSLTAHEFERAFLDQRRRSRGLPFGRTAKLHDALFALIENYCADPALRDPASSMKRRYGERSLRSSAGTGGSGTYARS